MEMANKMLIDICCDITDTQITSTEDTEIEKVAQATRDFYIERINKEADLLNNETFKFAKGYYFSKNPFEKQSIANTRMNIGKWLNGENKPSRNALLEFAITLGIQKKQINSLLEAYGHMRIVLRNPLDAFVYYNISNQKGLASFLILQNEYCTRLSQLQPKEEKEILLAFLRAFFGTRGDAEIMLKDASPQEKISYLCDLWECTKREENWLKAQFSDDKQYEKERVTKHYLDAVISAKYPELRTLIFALKELQVWNTYNIESCIDNTIGADNIETLSKTLMLHETAIKENGMRHEALMNLLGLLQNKKDVENGQGYSTRILEYIKKYHNVSETEFLEYLLDKEQKHLRHYSDGSRRQFAKLLSKILANYPMYHTNPPEILIPSEFKEIFSIAGMFCAYAGSDHSFNKLSTWSRNHKKIIRAKDKKTIIESIYPNQCKEIKAMLTKNGIREICKDIMLTDDQLNDILKKTHDSIFEVMHRHWIDPSTIIDDYIRPIIEGKREISRTALMLMALYADAKSTKSVSVERVLESAKYSPVEHSPADWIAYHLQKYSQSLPEISYGVFDDIFAEQLKALKEYTEIENGCPNKFECFKKIMNALVFEMKEYDIICFKDAIRKYASKMANSKSKTIPWRVFPITNPFVTMEFVHKTNSI